MIDIETLAGLLYEVYCAGVGGFAFNGDPLPSWNEFSSDTKKKKQADAWRSVATFAAIIPQTRARRKARALRPHPASQIPGGRRDGTP